LVADADILAAQQLLWRELRLVVEPAAALGLAALRAGLVQPQADETVALVLCGANVDPATLATAGTG
jgi:threonine dehydratase